MKRILNLTIILLVFAIISCSKKYDKEVVTIVKEWTGKKVSNIPLADYVAYNYQSGSIEKVTVRPAIYKILVYINEHESESCRLHLYDWDDFLKEVDSISDNVSTLIIAKPRNKSAFIQALRDSHFTHPVYIDEEGMFNAANGFPPNSLYHQFLLGRNNEVLFIGNPLNSPKIRKAYLSIIKGKQIENQYTDSCISKAELSTYNVELGEMSLKTKKSTNIMIRNVGKYPLIIQEVRTSCGCIQIDYNRKPIKEGESGNINVIYHATNLGVINKDVNVYCNTKESPYIIKIRGVVNE